MIIAKKLLCAYVCSWLVIFPTLSYAGEPVAVEAGDVVPHSGVLFTTVDAARLLASLESQSATCDARAESEVALAVNRVQLTLDNCQSQLALRTQMYDQRLTFYNDYSQQLEARLTKPKLSPELTLFIGILAGVGLTIGAGVAMNQAAASP